MAATLPGGNRQSGGVHPVVVLFVQAQVPGRGGLSRRFPGHGPKGPGSWAPPSQQGTRTQEARRTRLGPGPGQGTGRQGEGVHVVVTPGVEGQVPLRGDGVRRPPARMIPVASNALLRPPSMSTRTSLKDPWKEGA